MLATAISLTTFKLWFQSNICTCIARIHSIHIRRHQGAYQIRLFSSLLTNHHSNPSISYTHIYILSHPRPSLLFCKPQFSHHANKIRHKLVWRRDEFKRKKRSRVANMQPVYSLSTRVERFKVLFYRREEVVMEAKDDDDGDMVVVDFSGFLVTKPKKKNPPSLDWRR